MDFKNILNQLDEINGNDTESTPIESTLQSTPVASKQTLTESVAVARKSSSPSLKDVFNSLIEGAVTLEPVQSGAQTIKSDGEPVGVAHTPQAASQMKSAMEKGEITFEEEETGTRNAVNVSNEIYKDLITFGGDGITSMQWKNDQALELFKHRLAKKYNIDPKSLIRNEKHMPVSKIDKSYNVIVMPGDGDHHANRPDIDSVFFLGEGIVSDLIGKAGTAVASNPGVKDAAGKLATDAVGSAVKNSQGTIDSMASRAGKSAGDAAVSQVNKAIPGAVNTATDQAISNLKGPAIKTGAAIAGATGAAAYGGTKLANNQNKDGAKMNESKSPSQIAKDKADVKRDDKAEKAGKEVAKDAKYDGRKHPGKDGKEVAKDIEYDEWKEKKLPSISRIKKMCKSGKNQTQILKLHPKCDKQKLKDMIKKCKTNLKEGADHILKAAKHMGKSHGLCKGGYSCPHDEGSEGARAYHEGYKSGLDEACGMGIRNEPVVGMTGNPDMDEGLGGEIVGGIAGHKAGGAIGSTIGGAVAGVPGKVVGQIAGGALGMALGDKITGESEEGTVATMASYGADDLDEAEFDEGNEFSGAMAKVSKGDKFSVGGNTYTKTVAEQEKDVGIDDKYDWNASTEGDKEATYEDAWTFESMDAELDSLLNEDKVEEGIEITVNSGMEDQPDKVSVNATDDEADKLIKFVKDVGLGQYGDPEMDAEVIEPGEVSFYGSDAPSEEPVSSHDDMLKLMGIVDMEDDAEAPGTTDYEDEEAVDSVDVQVIDGDSEEEMCEACGSKMTNEGCGCSKTDEGANMAAQYGPDDGSHNSSNDEKGNAAANAALAANDADTPQLVKEKHESEAEADDHAEEAGKRDHSNKIKDEDEYDTEQDRKEHDHSLEENLAKLDEIVKEYSDDNDVKPQSDDMHEDQGYNDKEDESLGMKDGKESDKDDDEAGRRDQSKGDYGTRTDEDEHLKEMMAMLSEVGSEASEEPTQPLSQHDDDNLTTEGAEDAQADDLDGSIEPVTETQTEDQREFAVAEDDDLEEGKIPAGLKAYQDKKKGKKDDSEKDVKEEEEELTEWANDAGKNGTETSFEQDIDFMTKVISGGLNKQKSTGQTTIPVIAGQNDRMGYNGADVVKEGSVMSHDGLANLMSKMDELSK